MANWNLTPEIPGIANNLRRNYPSRSSWDTTDDGGLNGRSGDLSSHLRWARDNDLVVRLEPGGTYEMESQIDYNTGSTLAGVVCDESNPATIYYQGTSARSLFEFHNGSPQTFVLQGITVNITEGADTDVALARGRIGREGWSKGVSLVGQRDRFYASRGGRPTWAPVISDPSGTLYVEGLSLMDGDLTRSDTTFHDHAQGVNSNPDHHGTAVYWGCELQGWNDNGYYMANSPNGRNIMVDCYGADVRGGIFRMGRNDEVIGGVAEMYFPPDGWPGPGHCLSAYYGPPKRIVGLECRGNVFGNGLMVARDGRNGTPSTTLDRVVAHIDGDNKSPLIRLEDGAEWTLIDCYFYDESTTRAYSTTVRDGASIISDTDWHYRATSATEIELKHSNTHLDHAGQIYNGPDSLTVGDLGLGDPTPLPDPHFEGETDPTTSHDRGVTSRNAATQDLQSGVEVWLRER